MDLNTALRKLFSLHQFGVKLGLDNIEHLLAYIGNPEKELKAFHLAGSNGKGSTASFMASILQEAGYKVGLYTSPHLIRFNERIRINGKMIPDDYVAEFINELDDYINEHSPTFFELTTAMAFKYFADKEIDYAVVETGLGGRLDATNVLNPVAAVITSISFEHTHILGNSIGRIAGEKAGIFKPGIKVFLADMQDEAVDVFKQRAELLDCKTYMLADYSRLSNDSITVETENQDRITIYSTPLRGKYQLRNSALALFVLMNIMPEIKAGSVFSGIKNVIVNSGIGGRYEVYSDSPRIVFDAAHNSEGIDNFLDEFSNEYKSFDKCRLIIGMMKDKNIPEALKKLSRFFDNIYATTIDYERAATIDDLVSAGNETGVTIFPLPDAANFITEFRETGSNECLIILGSIYVIGEIKSKLERN